MRWPGSCAITRWPCQNSYSPPATAPTARACGPQHTVATLAEQLQLQLNLAHLKGGEKTLVDDALAKNGPVLIAWQYEDIPDIVNRIVGNATTCPQQWLDTRFDLVWVLDQAALGDAWTFNQVPQPAGRWHHPDSIFVKVWGRPRQKSSLKERPAFAQALNIGPSRACSLSALYQASPTHQLRVICNTHL